MSLAINLDYNSLRMEGYGNNTTIPRNDLARLMYYLNCISAVIQYDEQNKLIDYQRYYDLNKEEENAVYALAIVLNPKIFIDAKVVVINPNLVPEGYNNEFYRITDDRVGFHVNEEIVIGERVVRVLKIMACNVSWLNTYYYEPLERLSYRANLEKKQNDGSCCKKCCCWLCVILIIYILIKYFIY